MWDRAEEKLDASARGARAGVRAQPRRRRLLRAEDRHAHDRLARALLAARDRAARLLHARALRAELHRRGQPGAHARDDPPRDARLLRALHRDHDRALRAASSRCGWRPCRRSCCPSQIASTTTPRRSETACAASRSAVELDDRNESIGRKIRDAELRKIPYMLVVGEREQGEGGVRPHPLGTDEHHGGDLGSEPIEKFAQRLRGQL